MAALVLGFLVTGVAPAAAAGRPNIIFILADDMTAADLASMPRVKRLITDRGARFDRAYVNVSLCCPSRATILTGRYAHNTKVLTNSDPNGGFRAFRENGNEQSTIAVWLQRAGYRTALIGKYLNGYPGRLGLYVPQGWTHWAVPTTPAFSQYDYDLNVDGELEPHGSRPSDFAGDVLTRKANGFIDRAVKGGEPFFLYLSYLAPHTPAVAAPRHARVPVADKVPRTPSFNEADVRDKPSFYRLPRHTRAQIATLDGGYERRLRSLIAIDEAVASIDETLKRHRIFDETYLIFTSDNGYHLGEHRIGIGKESAFEEDLRVPLVMRGPGIPPGRRVRALVDNADLAPTFAAWAGAEPRRRFDGRPLQPLLKDDAPRWRRSLPIAHWGPDEPRPPTPDDGIFEGVPRVVAPTWRGLRSGRYLFVDYVNGERELYDTVADPYQLHNIASSAKRSFVAALARRAEELSTCVGNGCRALENEELPSAR